MEAQDTEAALKRLLIHISDCIVESRSEANFKTQILGIVSRFRELEASKAEVSEWNGFVIWVRSAYIGMGGLFNWYPIPDGCKSQVSEMSKVLEELLRKYWKLLGNEWHEPGSIEPIPNGKTVKLVLGELCLYEKDDKPLFVVEESDNWVVHCLAWFDYSNMPVYILERGTSTKYARHNALEVTDLSS